jgi:hypothetical protein
MSKNAQFIQAFKEADKTQIDEYLLVLKNHFDKIPSHLRGTFNQLKSEFVDVPNGSQFGALKSRMAVLIADFDFEIVFDKKGTLVPLPPSKEESQEKILFAYSCPERDSQARALSKIDSLASYEKIPKKSEYYILLPILKVLSNNFVPSIVDYLPTILHISGHGSKSGEFYIEQKNSPNGLEISLSSFVDKMQSIKQELVELKVVILNFCYSYHQAEKIKDLFDFVIFTKQEVPESVAIQYTQIFYDFLAEGKSILQAHKYTLNAEAPNNYSFKEFYDLYKTQ